MITPSYQQHVRTALLTIAFLVTALLLAPPIIESSFLVPKDYNEGWNAFQASHAFGEELLYPQMAVLYSNNYPPLSFYVVGYLGSLIGDNIIAGRLVSIVSFLLVAINIAAVVRLLGGDVLVSLFSGILYLGYMSAYHTIYVGMNDPQLLAHAIMMSGLVLFLLGKGKRLYLFMAVLLMITAGVVKHNLIALPVALTIWLFLYDRKALRFWIVSSFVLLLAAFVVFYTAYGTSFFAGVLAAPRTYSIGTLVYQVDTWTVPLQLWLSASFLLVLINHNRSDTILIGLYVVVSGIWGFFISGGVGVGGNAVFDLIIAVVIACGLFIGTLAQQCDGRWSRFSINNVAMLVLLFPILLKIPWAARDLKHVVIDLPEWERSVAMDIDFLAKHEGPVMCEDLALCYWAGKRLEVDFFNLGQKLKAGVVSEAVMTERLDSHYFSLIQVDSENGMSFRLPREVNDAVVEKYEVSRSSQVSGVFKSILVPKSTD